MLFQLHLKKIRHNIYDCCFNVLQSFLSLLLHFTAVKNYPFTFEIFKHHFVWTSCMPFAISRKAVHYSRIIKWECTFSVIFPLCAASKSMEGFHVLQNNGDRCVGVNMHIFNYPAETPYILSCQKLHAQMHWVAIGVICLMALQMRKIW